LIGCARGGSEIEALDDTLHACTPSRADALTSLAHEAPDAADATQLEARTLELLAEQFARVVPPREA